METQKLASPFFGYYQEIVYLITLTALLLPSV